MTTDNAMANTIRVQTIVRAISSHVSINLKSYLIVHKELYGVLITGVCPVQLKGEIDVVPHVVVTGHVVCKTLGKEYLNK